MFRNALLIAGKFTFPVVLSRLQWDGHCSSSIGAFVVVNADGWALTAGHIVDQISQLNDEYAATQAYEAGLAAANALPDPKQRNAALRKLQKPKPTSTKRWSVWWGGVATKTSMAGSLHGVDLGILKFDDLDHALVQQYPVFKDPKKDFEPGTSLCKLGFPFHSFKPIWDEATGSFHFPPNAVPLPRFPMDGIFTRTATLTKDPAAPDLPYDLMWVETSTPGLKGQSGGPTVDIHGTLWAVQCVTYNLSLGFDPKIPGGNGAKVHQFLNVGMGVHPVTMFGLMDQLGVKYEVSAY